MALLQKVAKHFRIFSKHTRSLSHYPIDENIFGLTDEQIAVSRIRLMLRDYFRLIFLKFQLRETIFAFAQNELAPHAHEIDQTNQFKWVLMIKRQDRARKHFRRIIETFWLQRTSFVLEETWWSWNSWNYGQIRIWWIRWKLFGSYRHHGRVVPCVWQHRVVIWSAFESLRESNS